MVDVSNDGEVADVGLGRGTRHVHIGNCLRRIRVNQGLPGRLRRGLELEDGPIAVDSAKILATRKSESIVQVTLHSGRNRIVRRIFDAVDHPVTRLIRTSVGPILLGELPIGAVRELTHRENEELVTVVGL